MKIFVVLTVFLMSSAAMGEETTATRYIWQFNIDASLNVHYFRAANNATSSSSTSWGAPSCPNAEYVYTQSLAGQKDILAVALSASALGRPVSFIGVCQAGGNYFVATRILMGQG